MRKGRTVIGQDVYSLADGQRLQSVKDLLVDQDHDTIVALLVDEGGLLGTSTIVPIESVHRFGPNAVMVANAESVIPASADDRVAAVLGRKTTLLGTPVVTTEGQKVGSIGDMYFDERSGSIVGYEVSGGTIGDAMRGSSWLPLEAINVIGPDAVIATPEAAEIVDSQVGGIQGALDSARDRAASAGDSLGEAASSAVNGDGGEDREDPVAQDPDGTLVGRRASTDVMDNDGSVVVAAGQRVNLEHVHRARDEERLDALYASVGVERPVPMGEQVSAAAESAVETAGDLWGRFTNRLSDMTDSAGRRVDAQQTKSQLDRIHDAIGRPVTKVFLDRDDNVILDLGDLVTHQAVQRAHEAGMLDSMLDSIYKGEVTFSRDEMRAPTPGDSTIEEASGGAVMLDELETRLDEAEHPPETDETDESDDPDTEAAAADASEVDASEADAPGADADWAEDRQPVHASEGTRTGM